MTDRPDALEELAARLGLEPMLTIKQLAALALESRRTIERRIAAGLVEVVHLSPRCVRIPQSSADAYLAGRGALRSRREEATIHDLTDHLSEGGDRDR